jgi:hypothetical protein
MTDLLSVLSIARNGTSREQQRRGQPEHGGHGQAQGHDGRQPHGVLRRLVRGRRRAGPGQDGKAYENYEDTTDYYKEVNKYAQEAAEKQRDADDQDKATSMSSGMVAFCDKNNIGYSTKGGDKKHDEDQWQSLRDGLDSEKNIASTDMKMAGAEFDQAAKDCDSSQQMAVDCVKKNTDIFGTLAKTI